MAALVGAGSPVSGAAPVRARVITFEAAEGMWLIDEGRNVYIYYVLAFRLGKAGQPSTTRLLVDRSKCRLRRGANKRFASCAVGGRMQKVPRRALRIDPLLAGARLDYRGHRLVWQGTEEPEPEVDPFVDPEAAFADAYLSRLAGVRGRLFGRRMPVRALETAQLSYGVDAAVITRLDDPPRPVRFTVQVTLP